MHFGCHVGRDQHFIAQPAEKNGFSFALEALAQFSIGFLVGEAGGGEYHGDIFVFQSFEEHQLVFAGFQPADAEYEVFQAKFLDEQFGACFSLCDIATKVNRDYISCEGVVFYDSAGFFFAGGSYTVCQADIVGVVGAGVRFNFVYGSEYFLKSFSRLAVFYIFFKQVIGLVRFIKE